MTARTAMRRAVSLVAVVAALLAASMTAAYSAPGGIKGAPPGGGGGGGGKGPPVTETSNNLSVPAIFVGNTTEAPALKFACGAAVPASGTTSTFPDDFVLPLTGVTAGEYYVQGEGTWQAQCSTAAADTLTATAKWGDNLAGGEAALKVGSPVRVEVALLADPANYDYTGFETVKLTDELDRLATYGTLGVAQTPYISYNAETAVSTEEIRVWAEGAQFKIDGPVVLDWQDMSAEINSTGRVVYGYNWRPSVAGTYTLSFRALNVDVETQIVAVVAGSAGGGGGRVAK